MEHAQPGNHIPPDLVVVVAANSKIFHVPGCKFIGDKSNLRTITAAEAMREGYAPCVRCLKKYLATAQVGGLPGESQEARFSEEDGN